VLSAKSTHFLSAPVLHRLSAFHEAGRKAWMEKSWNVQVVDKAAPPIEHALQEVASLHFPEFSFLCQA
jgi:hypothetical protein